MFNRYGFTQKSSFDRAGNDLTTYTTDSVVTSLDSYGLEALDEALAYLNQYNPGHKYATFGFITDIHKGHNFSYAGISAHSDQTFQLIGELNKTYELDAVLCGGDILNGYDDPVYYEDNAQWVFDEFSKYLPYTAVCTTIGNHDKRYNDTVPLRSNEFLSRLHRGMNCGTAKVSLAELRDYPTNYAVDFKEHKIRIIMLNEYDAIDTTGTSTSTGKWKRFMNLKNADEWLLGIVNHSPGHFSPETESIRNYIDGTSSVGYTNTNGVGGKGFIGNICGHTHSYGSHNAITAVVGSAYDVEGYIGTRKSVYCFAVFIVDTDRNKLVMVKVGREAGVVEYDFITA